MNTKNINTYKTSGVDIEKSNQLVKKIQKISSNFTRKEIINNPGGFSALFDLKKLNYRDPILLSSTDGVGTKLKLAIESEYFDKLGFDLVGMCVNDIIVNGGEPLFFLDYISVSKINEKMFIELIKSINLACKAAGCPLVGGETAEMPGLYKKGDFDIAGFTVGVVERKNLIEKKNIQKNDLIFGLESNGFHSNGFSLIRKILKKKKINIREKTPYRSKSNFLYADLLRPTKIYVDLILPLIKKKMINSLAHITGGGIKENLERVIPDNLQAILDLKSYVSPECFIWLSKLGKIDSSEMIKTFNCGIGLILIVDRKKELEIKKYFSERNIKLIPMGVLKKTKDDKKVIIKKFSPWF